MEDGLEADPLDDVCNLSSARGTGLTKIINQITLLGEFQVTVRGSNGC